MSLVNLGCNSRRGGTESRFTAHHSGASLVFTDLGDTGAISSARGFPCSKLFSSSRWLWFALIGILLFVVDEQFSIDRNEILVTAAMQERLGGLWTTQTGLTASEQELDALVENWIREEILYQEALRLGLDQEDSIVRRRLVQKLGFIAETEDSAAPERGAVEAFYENNLASYTLPVRYSFQQLYFASRGDAQQAVAEIAGGADPRSLGESSMLNSDYAYRSALDLKRHVRCRLRGVGWMASPKIVGRGRSRVVSAFT